MNGSTLQVLQVEWERAWLAEDFDRVSRIDQARRVIEGLETVRTEQAAPTMQAAPLSETETPTSGSNPFEAEPTGQTRETAPRMQSQKPRRMFVRFASFTK